MLLKHILALMYPDKGDIRVFGRSLINMGADELYKLRENYGVLFQDGALFGSMNLYDNVAFPLRQHTKFPEDKIRRIVMSNMNDVGPPRRRLQACRARSPAACASGPASPGPWSCSPRSSCSTSRTRASTRSAPACSTI